MCLGCYDDFFSLRAGSAPPSLTPGMVDLAGEIMEADRDNGLEFSGLHIVIADWNLEDEHLEYCRSQQGQPLTPVQDDIAARLLSLTLPQRFVVMKAAQALQRIDDESRRQP